MIDTVAVSTIGDKSKRPKFDSAPVIIEDDVWIGFNATILKGVTIGKGSIIQPGAVVSQPPCRGERSRKRHHAPGSWRCADHPARVPLKSVTVRP